MRIGVFSYICIMGNKVKKASPDILYNMSRMMVPKDILEYFEVADINELHSEWRVVLHEKVTLIPGPLEGVSEVVLDGYCNPLQMMSHCFSLKPIYLVIKRRRWKRAGTDEHFSNEYDIQKTSAKLTAEMAGFFKRQN